MQLFSLRGNKDPKIDLLEWAPIWLANRSPYGAHVCCERGKVPVRQQGNLIIKEEKRSREAFSMFLVEG